MKCFFLTTMAFFNWILWVKLLRMNLLGWIAVVRGGVRRGCVRSLPYPVRVMRCIGAL